MKLSVESVEVATLKANGQPWDGPGGPRLPADQLAAFFARDLDAQLAQLVQAGAAPVPPDLFLRVFVHNEQVIETTDQKSFDAEWPADEGTVEVKAGAPLTIEVWDRDLMFDDLVGKLEVAVPAAAPAGGRWVLPGFDQVRRLVLRLA